MPGRADLPALAAIGALQLAGYFAFAHVAVAWVPAGRTAILANTTTIWIVPLSLVFLHEQIPPRRWVAAGIGLAGVVVLISPWAIDWTSPPVLIGHAFLLLASLCWSVAIIVTRAARPSLSMFELLPWCFGLASLLLLPLVLYGGAARNAGVPAGMLAGACLYRLPGGTDRHLVRRGGDRQTAHHGFVDRLPDHARGQIRLPGLQALHQGAGEHRRRYLAGPCQLTCLEGVLHSAGRGDHRPAPATELLLDPHLAPARATSPRSNAPA